MTISFDVIGTPAPQGSKSFMGMSKKGHAILVESCVKVKPWRLDVAALALKARLANGGHIFDGPVNLRVEFRMPRPKSLPKKVIHHTKKPDCSKLLRSTEDALVTAQIISDDSIIVSFDGTVKRYALPEESTGAFIEITDV